MLQAIHDWLRDIVARDDCSGLDGSRTRFRRPDLEEFMSMKKRTVAAVMVGLYSALAACSPSAQKDPGADAAQPAVPTQAEALPDHADWAGKWTGVEGMFLEIVPSRDGTYSLTMQSDLDTLGTYEGRDTAGGIAFERGGKELLLTPASGDETGLKYLAGKDDCLMVANGEGYCRD